MQDHSLKRNSQKKLSYLANTLGNLVNRTISMVNKYFGGSVSNKDVSEEVDTELKNMVTNLDNKVTLKMDELQVGEAIDEIFDVLRRSNKYIDETMPWSLAKDELKQDRLETVLYNLLESIRVCACSLAPFMPDTSVEILRQLNTEHQELEFIPDLEYHVNDAKVLCARSDKDAKLKEISEK